MTYNYEFICYDRVIETSDTVLHRRYQFIHLKPTIARETFNPGRLARDQLLTSSHANIQVSQFRKTHAIYQSIAKY